MNPFPEYHLKFCKNLLLNPYEINDEFLCKTLSNLTTASIDYADIYFQHTRSESWSLEEGIVKSGTFSIDQGVGVRACSGNQTGFAYSDNISQEAIKLAAKAASTIGSHAIQIKSTNQSSKQSRLKQQLTNSHYNLYSIQDPLNSLGTKDKINLLQKIERIAKSKDPRVTQVMASLSAEFDAILVARNDGLVAADIRPLVRLSLTVIAEQNGRREIGISGGGGRHDYTYFSDNILNQYAFNAVSSALKNLEAVAAPAGNMTVVLGPGWPGILLHEAVGHGLEGDFNQKKLSAFSDKIGQRVAAPGVTIVDDGTYPNSRGSLNIDDEGNPTMKTVLIEDGFLRGYMHDSMSARLMNHSTPTGNGRRESFATPPMPRMTNTYMLAGEYTPKEIISSVKKGLYAVNFSGGQVDITNGKFVFSASEAYLIENGQLSHPVKGASLVGSGPESLKYISMIGNNLSLDEGVGTCGKDGQSIPVSVGQPTLRIDNMTVGGTGLI